MNGETTKQQQQQHRRQPKLCIGDLYSGRAFDNNCICFERVNGFRRRECTCNVSSSIDFFIQSFAFRIEFSGTKISTCERIYDGID